jgi:hypothetical protein
MKKYIKPAAIECEFTFIDHIAQQIHEGSVDIQLTKEREEDAASEKESEEKNSWTEGLW